MHIANITSFLSISAICAVAVEKAQSPVWWLGLVVALASAIVQYINANKQK
jgi:hypothetical protein